MRELTTNEIDQVSGGEHNYTAISTGVGLFSLGIAIALTGGSGNSTNRISRRSDRERNWHRSHSTYTSRGGWRDYWGRYHRRNQQR